MGRKKGQPARLRVAGLTDKGPVRRRNEDDFLIDTRLGLLMVADGVGGLADGQVASHEALKSVHHFLSRQPPDEDDSRCDDTQHFVAHWSGHWQGSLRRALDHGNGRLRALNLESGGVRPMASTLVGVLLSPRGRAAITFHVGDSRLYLFRDGALRQVTRDQSAYQRWLDAGRTTDPPGRNVLLQALGARRRVEGFLADLPLAPGDKLLLCSDGLSNCLEDALVEEVLREANGEHPKAICGRLVDMVLSRRGKDNVTVVLGCYA